MMDNCTGWILMESVTLIVFSYFAFAYGKKYNTVEWIFIILFLAHYINRSFIFPNRLKTKGKKIPVAIVASGIFHNCVNGFLIGYYLSHFSNYDSSWIFTPQFIIGIIIFFTGVIINWHSDNILIHLRGKNKKRYKIPKRGMFQYVSSPNLLGEFTEWAGYAILTWSLPGLCFAIFTFCNLLPRALDTHKWYLQNFDGYPQNRKTLIPYIL